MYFPHILLANSPAVRIYRHRPGYIIVKDEDRISTKQMTKRNINIIELSHALIPFSIPLLLLMLTSHDYSIFQYFHHCKQLFVCYLTKRSLVTFCMQRSSRYDVFI